MPRQENKSPKRPLAFYLVMSFIFMGPLLAGCIRFLSGKHFVVYDEHMSSLLTRTPFGLAMIMCIWCMQRRPRLATSAATWVIHVGTFSGVVHLAPVAYREMINQRGLAVEDIALLFFYMGGILFLNVYARSISKGWRDFRGRPNARRSK